MTMLVRHDSALSGRIPPPSPIDYLRRADTRRLPTMPSFSMPVPTAELVKCVVSGKFLRYSLAGGIGPRDFVRENARNGFKGNGGRKQRTLSSGAGASEFFDELDIAECVGQPAGADPQHYSHAITVCCASRRAAQSGDRQLRVPVEMFNVRVEPRRRVLPATSACGNAHGEPRGQEARCSIRGLRLAGKRWK